MLPTLTVLKASDPNESLYPIRDPIPIPKNDTAFNKLVSRALFPGFGGREEKGPGIGRPILRPTSKAREKHPGDEVAYSKRKTVRS